MTLADLTAVVHGEREAGPRELMITFDDAYRGLREHAFPVLEAHGFSAVCSVITDYAGRLNRWDVAYGGRRFAHLAWRDLAHWQSRGIECISHTATHPRLTWLTPVEVGRELSRSARALESRLGTRSVALSYPFGAVGAREQHLATLEGYSLGLTLATRWRGDPMAISRLPIYVWSPPAPAVGILAPVEWFGAAAANRCAVGTTIWQRMRRPW